MNVNFNIYPLRTRNINASTEIFDIVRKKWVILTPEEQVRQLWLQHITIDLGYSISSIGVEKGFLICNQWRRFDICVYINALPYIIIECKSPSSNISIDHLLQMSEYNSNLKCRYCIVTNGVQHIGYDLYSQKNIELRDSIELRNHR